MGRNNRKKTERQKTEQKAYPLNSSEASLLFGFLPTASKINVGATNAMRVPAGACAVGNISEKIGDIPFKLYNRI